MQLFSSSVKLGREEEEDRPASSSFLRSRGLSLPATVSGGQRVTSRPPHPQSDRQCHHQAHRKPPAATPALLAPTLFERKIILLVLCLSILPICLIVSPSRYPIGQFFSSSSSSSSSSFRSPPPPKRTLIGEEDADEEEQREEAATHTLSLAVMAAQYHQKVAATSSFLSWSQNVGASFSEFWHDKPCTTTTTTFAYCAASQVNASAGITNYSCGQRPPGRLHAAAVSYGYARNTGGGTAITSYVLAFGGVNGGILDDMWVFANGLVNGERTSGQNRDIRDPSSGFNTSCKDPSSSSCSSCNRWHQVRARAVPRSATLCKLQPTACSSSNPTDLAAAPYVNATLENFGLTGHAATLMSLTPVATAVTQGSVLSFGGLRQGYGLSAETWYLNKLPFPTLGATAPGYDALFPPTNSDVEWRCADIYGHGDRYPPEPNCAAQMESDSTTLTGPNGTIQSGRLLPVTQCSWTIAPTHYYNPDTHTLHVFSTELHAILITVDKLELESSGRFQGQEHSKASHCESYMAVRDTGTTSPSAGNNGRPAPTSLIVRGCNRAMLKTSSYVSTTGRVSVSIDYHKDCPHHAGMALSYRVVNLMSDELFCKGGCSGRGRCQAGKCVCDHGRLGPRCGRVCRAFGGCPPDADAAVMTTTSGTTTAGTEAPGTAAARGGSATEVYPRPRQGHSLVSVFREASAKEIISSEISVAQVVTDEVSSPANLIQCRNDTLQVGCVIVLASCCVGSSVTSVETPLPLDLPDEFTHLGIFADKHVTNTTELFKCIQRDRDNELLCAKFERTTATIKTRTVSTKGTTRQILFGGWSGSKALNDLWVLDMMEPVAADLSTYLDCALPVDYSSGNDLVSSAGESPIPQRYGMVGLDGVHLNRSKMKFTHVPCPKASNPSRPTFPITARRSRWTQLASTMTTATVVANPNTVPPPPGPFWALGRSGEHER